MNSKVSRLRSTRMQPARVALLGTGTVGSALWSRLAAWDGSSLGGRLSLVHVANSRIAVSNRKGIPANTLEIFMHNMPQASSLEAVDAALDGAGTRIVIDATASDAVASQHASWLARGIHVVTACKLGQGTTLERWYAIQSARHAGGTHYGDSATVGAGLPVLRSLRELQAGGDRIHAIAGVLSGSLAWLCNQYDGLRPFSGFVREARDAGYTEPDPREDLSGEDVRRKLLILARAAGYPLAVDAVQVDSLLPAGLAALALEDVDSGLQQLDAPLRDRYAAAWNKNEKLRFIARLQDGLATIGLEPLAADHPLAGGAGTDNKIAIWSDRYREQPLMIQGPGAGAAVTAAALLDDALAIHATSASGSELQADVLMPKKVSIGCGRWST
ncbi:MAG: homoserine dehydrogenase [Thermomonas sp.]